MNDQAVNDQAKRDQSERAALFRSLHAGTHPLVLVNAWDAASARIVQAAGALAVATTSAGVAWSLGAPDGDVLTREAAVAHIARVAAAVSVPVTADIESGFGATADEVSVTARAVYAAGAVGVNIEDTVRGSAGGLRDIAEQCDRLAAASAVPLFVNARVDTYLRGSGTVADTVARAEAYLAAGASGIFVPGVHDPDTIRTLTAAIPAPLNILAGPGAPSVPELAKLGVARVSLGSSVAEAAYAVVQRAAAEAFSTGTYATVADALEYDELNALMKGPRR